MFTSLALAAAATAPHWGWGFPWFAILIPLFWIGVIVLIVALAGRRWRRGPWAGGGYGYGPPWAHAAQAARGAEVTLAERFANGDIDEQEYRARLEVIRANAPQPPTR